MSNRFLSPCPVLSYTVDTISCPCFTQTVSSLPVQSYFTQSTQCHVLVLQTVSSLPLQSYFTQSTQCHVLVLHKLFPLSLSNPILHSQHNVMSLFYTNCFLSPSPILFYTVNTTSCPCFTQTVSSLLLQSYFTQSTQFHVLVLHRLFPLSLSNPTLHSQHNVMSLFYTDSFLSPSPILVYTVNTISCLCFTQTVSSLLLQSYFTQSTQFHVLVLHRLFPLSLSNPILQSTQPWDLVLHI